MSLVPAQTITARFSRLSTSRKVIVVVFLIWLMQALPKWTAAITADGELSARIMKLFVTPRSETQLANARQPASDAEPDCVTAALVGTH
jgi:hypothetical protein